MSRKGWADVGVDIFEVVVVNALVVWIGVACFEINDSRGRSRLAARFEEALESNGSMDDLSYRNIAQWQGL